MPSIRSFQSRRSNRAIQQSTRASAVTTLALGAGALVLLAPTGCDSQGKSKAPGPAPASATKLPSLEAADPAGEAVLASLDVTADPCVDFYDFACGGWMAKTQLPPDQPIYGSGFSTVQERNEKTVRGILENAKASGDPKLVVAGSYYESCLDESTIDARGTQPLEPYLARIDKVKKKADLFRLMGELQVEGLDAGFFSVGFGFDDKDPDLVAAQLGQGGLGLPDRSFYLQPEKKPILDGYRAHVAKMLAFIGLEGEQGTAAADQIVAFETGLAASHLPPEELRIPEKVYNPMTPKEVDGKMPSVPFAKYLKAIGRPDLKRVIVANPEFLTGLDQAVANTELDTLKLYAKWFVFSSASGIMSREIQEANFEFTAALTGAKELPPRWKQCARATTGAVGDIVSEAFVARTFPGDSKDIATQMIKDVEAAFEGGLAKLEWMDDPTRERAVEKMGAITNKIGFPDEWRTYDGLELGPNYFENALAAREANAKYYRDMLDGPSDRGMWFMPSSMVNAYYNPSLNEIVFPAGILQPPFFGHDRPQSLNYGAIGMVMGHEITHGFDDSGRKYDGKGVLTEWWAPEVSERFDATTQCIGETYSAIEVQPGAKLNAELTMGENIADFGGIKQAYRAYQLWTERNGAETPSVAGLSNEQLLFVGYAQAWCSMATPEIEKLLATVDPHSPPRYRINVPLAHLPEFWDAYGCTEGTPMHAQNVCTVW